METFERVVGQITDFLWGWPMIVMLLGVHIFLTIRLRFPQLQIFKAIRLSFKKDHGASGDVSQFGALATSLAATVGTGNIVGVATAVALGGPGAVLWCWLTGVFGIATKYSEGLLSIKYRVRTADGTMLGGPMYAIERGMKMKWLAVLFAIFTAVAALGIGNTVQANAISTLLSEPGLFGESFGGISTVASGLVMALLVALVIIFGVKGIAKVCTAFVPFMAIFYVAGCLIIIFMNWSYMGETVSVIFKSAFSAQAAGGGFIGSTVMMAARYGIARGLFSNESGMGSAPIVAAAAKTRNPVRQALVSSTATGETYATRIRENSLCRLHHSYSRVGDICLFHHSRLVVLCREGHRISGREEIHKGLQSAVGGACLCGRCGRPLPCVGHSRRDQRPYGNPEPYISRLFKRSDSCPDEEISLE